MTGIGALLMVSMKSIMRSGIIAAAALIAWQLWCIGTAGEGLTWLQGFQWGAVPVSIMIATACAAAVIRDNSPTRLLLFIVTASATCFTAFAAGRAELYEVFGGITVNVAPLIRLALYGIAVSVSLPWLADRLLRPLHWWTALVSAAALVLAVTLACLTVAYFPGDRHPDLFNAIRLGYPVLWTALLLPAALWTGIKRLSHDVDHIG